MQNFIAFGRTLSKCIANKQKNIHLYIPFTESKGFTGSKKMLKVCPDVCPGSKEHYRPEHELRDVSMLSGVI